MVPDCRGSSSSARRLASELPLLPMLHPSALGRSRWAVLLLLLAPALAPRAGAEGEATALEALLGPALPLEDHLGRAQTIEGLEGRVVLLDFWATWCAPCLAQMPVLRRAWTRHGSDGLVIVGVPMERIEPAALRRWLRTRDLSWPQILDRRGFGGELARRLGVESVPRTFLFDRAGRLVGTDLDGPALEASLEVLVAMSRQGSDDVEETGLNRVRPGSVEARLEGRRRGARPRSRDGRPGGRTGRP